MTLDDVEHVLDLAGVQGHISSSNYVFRCPFAALGDPHKHVVDRKAGMGVAIRNDEAVFNCFTCKRRGPLERLLQLLHKELDVNVTKATEVLNDILLNDIEFLMQRLPEYEELFKSNPNTSHRIFPESWLDPYRGSVPKYIIDRGVTLATCKRWGLGHDKKDRRVVFPVRDHRSLLVGAVGGLTHKAPPNVPRYRNYWSKIHRPCQRALDSRYGYYRCAFCDQKKRVYENQTQDGFRKSLFLFGEHLMKRKRIPVLLEGMVDTLKVDQAMLDSEFSPQGIFGSEMSKEQARRVVSLAKDRLVVLFMDKDSAGRKATKQIYEMLSSQIRLHIADYSQMEEGDDPGKLSEEQIQFAIENSKALII